MAEQTTESPPTEGEYESYAIKSEEEEYQIVETEREQELSFTRIYEFPERVDREAAKAKLDHGVLTVILPKLHAEPPRYITIE